MCSSVWKKWSGTSDILFIAWTELSVWCVLCGCALGCVVVLKCSEVVGFQGQRVAPAGCWRWQVQAPVWTQAMEWRKGTPPLVATISQCAQSAERSTATTPIWSNTSPMFTHRRSTGRYAKFVENNLKLNNIYKYTYSPHMELGKGKIIIRIIRVIWTQIKLFR